MMPAFAMRICTSQSKPLTDGTLNQLRLMMRDPLQILVTEHSFKLQVTEHSFKDSSYKFKLAASFAFGLCPSPCLLVPSCTALAAKGPMQASQPSESIPGTDLSRDALLSRHPSARTGLTLGRLGRCGPGPPPNHLDGYVWRPVVVTIAGPGRRRGSAAAGFRRGRLGTPGTASTACPCASGE